MRETRVSGVDAEAGAGAYQKLARSCYKFDSPLMVTFHSLLSPKSSGRV